MPLTGTMLRLEKRVCNSAYKELTHQACLFLYGNLMHKFEGYRTNKANLTDSIIETKLGLQAESRVGLPPAPPSRFYRWLGLRDLVGAIQTRIYVGSQYKFPYSN
jgi:hypothetical protein